MEILNIFYNYNSKVVKLINYKMIKRGCKMKTAIIYKSVHRGNTKKIAEALAETLEADLFDLNRC